MTDRGTKRLGLFGLGTIGGHIARSAAEQGFATLDFVMAKDSGVTPSVTKDTVWLRNVSELAARQVDLVVEAVDGAFAKRHALTILEQSDLLLFSLTCLANDTFRERLRTACQTAGTRLYVPHGAVLGLDGIHDGRALIEHVSVRTTKHPGNLGLDSNVDGVLFDGSTREACAKFPQNVNVHAAVALAGIGFDRTKSVIVADPSSKRMIHDISVEGQGLSWTIHVESQAVGAVTGSYTPESAAMTVRRILAGDYNIVIA